MTIDLLQQNKNYAIYLPAIQEPFAKYVMSEDKDVPIGLSPSDLNFLDGENRFWRYGKCLASAGLFTYSSGRNSITHRNPQSSWVLGDSGGYQVGTGALKEIRKKMGKSVSDDEILRLWNETEFIHDMLRWVECNCDYAMTLDMPLWTKDDPNSTSPFRHLEKPQLLDATIDNLKYIEKYRGSYGACKFLNVIQGSNDADEDWWYNNIKRFRFEGWAFGGTEQWKGGLSRVLRRVLILRDDKELQAGQDLLHLLGVSQTNWTIALTEIQRGVQKTANAEFRITFDSATPFHNAGSYMNYFKPQEFGSSMRSWLRNLEEFDSSQTGMSQSLDDPFCVGSPLSDALTIRDAFKELSAYKHDGKYEENALSKFGQNALANHNVYMTIDGFNKACRLANDDGHAPTEFLDMIDVIRTAFATEQWSSFIDDKREFLESVSNYSGWKRS